MGEKKELRKALEETRHEMALVRQDLEMENNQLRAQLAEATSAPLKLLTDPKAISVRGKIAEVLGIDPTSYQGGVTDEMILEAVERLRNPHHDASFGDGIMVHKNDSLAEAIHANRAERRELDDQLSRSRVLLNQVAGALGVSQLTPDGAELLEKAQRFSVFWHWVKKRMHEHEASVGDTTSNDPVVEQSVAVAQALANELRTVLAVLLGEKRLSELLKNKPLKVSKDLLALAMEGAPSGNTYLDREFTPEDTMHLAIVFDSYMRESPVTNTRVGQLQLVFKQLERNPVARHEFTMLMNVLVLPLLRKAHPAYQKPDGEEQR